MGFFILSRRECAGPGRAWWEAHARSGFGRQISLNANDWNLQLVASLDGSGPHHVSSSDDFAACTGIFFYRGKRLEAGLGQLLADFDGRRFPWDDCRGHYAVILFKAGRLWLASDELGGYKIYRNLDWTALSSSFSALRALLPTALPDVQGLYEYAFNGATFGEKTLLRHVKQQRTGVLYELSQPGAARIALPESREAAAHPSLEEAADDYASRLRGLFRVYADSNRNFRTALSGGYDSRLIVALLLDAGVDPELFVYGPEGDPDVVVAQAIARGEGLRLLHIDKDRLDGQRSIERAWARFDSWKVDGLFDQGVDDEDRRIRASGADVLNGSGGECFRNFFYLREGAYRPEEIVWSFYSQYDPSQLTYRFRPADYAQELAHEMRLALPDQPSQGRLSRAQVEALYPLFRVRYWAGRDVGLNQRFGPLLFPFLEPAVFSGTERLPIGMKDYGRLEASILRRISPKLAAYTSAYGFPFSKDPPALYRMKMALTYCRPPYLRQFTYRLKSRLRPRTPPPAWLVATWEAAGIDPKLPLISEFFRPGRVSDLAVLNRLATAELVLRGTPMAPDTSARGTEMSGLPPNPSQLAA